LTGRKLFAKSPARLDAMNRHVCSSTEIRPMPTPDSILNLATEIVETPITQALTKLTADRVLSPYIWVFYASFLLSICFTPIARAIAMSFGIIDQPDGKRKMHREPVAYLGGLAIFTAWFAGVTLSQFVHWHVWFPGMSERINVPLAVVFGAVTAFTLGLWDDIKGLRPRTKIVGQVSAAVLLLVSGVGTTLTQPFILAAVDRLNRAFAGYIAISPGAVEIMVLVSSCALAIAIVVFCCNASNLMDGLDGLCSGVTTIITAGFLCLAVVAATHPNPADFSSINTDALRVIIALSLLGAAMGFVPHNFNPASIFMGDAGSLFLGFICALLIIMLGEADPRWLLGATVMFALPVLDTALAFARRYMAGRPFFSADKQHIHHQLIARGLSVKQAVLIMYGLALFFVACGMSLILIRVRYAIAFYLVILGGIVVAAYKMGMVHERIARHQRGPNLDQDPAAAEVDKPETPSSSTRPPSMV
jgi:UDP-GlcNAc:undecaprenyl-phosphate/decaprenyl-phosphate GlcNAc-1-phosphate transferase